MWRVPSERIALDLDGPTVEVEPVHSWHVQYEGLRLMQAFMAAEKPEDEYALLNVLFEHFLTEAQPQWDICDHKGPVPLTVTGMSRLPPELSRLMTMLWLDTLKVAAAEEEKPREPLELSVIESQAPTAVDAVVPPGPLNREIKRRMRRAKAA